MVRPTSDLWFPNGSATCLRASGVVQLSVLYPTGGYKCCSLLFICFQIQVSWKHTTKQRTGGAVPSEVQVGWESEVDGFSGIGGDILGPHVPKVGAFPLTHELEVHRTATEIAGSNSHILEGQPHLSPSYHQLL